MPAFCLSIHAGYKCGHSGACCTAGWPITIEPGQRAVLVRLGLMPHSATGATSVPGAAERVLTLHSTDGACVFYEAGHGRLCAVHRRAGEHLLPSACRNFPRVALHDSRGTFITLSHYCPTAARMLLDTAELAVVDAPSSLSLNGTVEGLDASGVMPPLLRAGMLMDLDGYTTWERGGLEILNDRRLSAAAAVAVISAATLDACAWSPGREALTTRVRRAFDHARDAVVPAAVLVPRLEHAVKAFLAAHLFASWSAYQGWGLAAVVHSLESALGLLGSSIVDDTSFIAAVRAADFQTRHTHTHAGPGSLPALRRD